MLEAEAITLEANRPGRLRTMVVSPGALLGTGTGTLLGGLSILFLRRELPFRLLEDVWVAVTAVSDVGPALVAALERGSGGRRYFAIGPSLRLGAIYRMLEERSGVPAPRRRLPDLLAEELGLLAPLLPAQSFLRRLVLPRELVLHLRRLAPARNDRTRTELGFTPRSVEMSVDDLIRREPDLPR
jgi:nucleoside-diphosphate-sugar epimerase